MVDKTILSKLKLAVVDDHALVREGIASVLSRNGADNVSQFSNAMQLKSELDAGNSFDFYIIDIELPDLDGFVLIEMIRAHNPVAHIIINTVHDEIWTLRKLLSRDVNAIIYKSGEGDEIVTAISEILDGNNYYCNDVKRETSSLDDKSMLPTSRELEVLFQIAQGKTSREIAAALFVTDNTVEAHRKSLFQKLGATNVADLIMKAFSKGYLRKR